MMKNEISIDGRLCFLYQDEAATHLLIQPIDEHDLAFGSRNRSNQEDVR